MDNVLLNDFGRRWKDTAPDVMSALARVGGSGSYVLGREVRAFEHALAASMERLHAIGCASGLDAIEIALRSAGVEPGAKVLTTPFSAFATTLAIVRAGAVPVFVDVDDHGLIDLGLCRKALSSDPAIRAMVPVHLFGHAIDLPELASLRGHFDLLVVEDCAQSIGARSHGRPVGSAGRLAATSFYPTKNLGALGDGGAVLTDEEALAHRCRSLRDYGQASKYVHDELGMNSRLDEIQAGLLLDAFLPRLPGWTRQRQAIAGAYVAGIRHRRVRVPGPPPGSESVWHLFPVVVDAGDREGFMRHMEGRGVQTAVHYPRLIPGQRALQGVPFEVIGKLDRAQELANGEVSLPIHPYLDDAEVSRVVDAVNDWVGP
jgi:dTDP-3-amino-3,4,6-trideoxy-alpha-D-glucose transaminase